MERRHGGKCRPMRSDGLPAAPIDCPVSVLGPRDPGAILAGCHKRPDGFDLGREIGPDPVAPALRPARHVRRSGSRLPARAHAEVFAPDVPGHSIGNIAGGRRQGRSAHGAARQTCIAWRQILVLQGRGGQESTERRHFAEPVPMVDPGDDRPRLAVTGDDRSPTLGGVFDERRQPGPGIPQFHFSHGHPQTAVAVILAGTVGGATVCSQWRRRRRRPARAAPDLPANLERDRRGFPRRPMFRVLSPCRSTGQGSLGRCRRFLMRAGSRRDGQSA